ncbi:MAG: helix-hairpin-helix domain-containing protein [Xanthomonadaceae bacterium]|nr:helix-hairpin-helix domain-containing protein [Xanthomonadaceae bacterium]
MMELHTRYRQATIFDQLWLALARGLRRPAWLQGRRAWGWAFGLLAGLFGVIGAAFLLDALAPMAGNSALASLGSALLSLGVFRHFARCALPLLQPHGARHRVVPRVRAGEGSARPVPVPGVERPTAGVPAAAATPARIRPVSTLSAAERRAYLAGLRCAGVNVSIARALVSAGYLSAAAVERASDAQILAIRGVGPATLRKIRAS